MIHAPHPSLRRLFALGSAPGRALSALDAGRAALDALSRELDALPLLSDAALAALAAALDLSPLDAALEGRPLPRQKPEAAGAPGGVGRRAGEQPTPVPDRPRPLAAFPASARARRAVGIRTAPDAPAEPAAAARIEALLARHAPQAGGQPAQDTAGGPTRESRSGDLPGTPRHRAAGGASGEVRERVAVPEVGAARRPAKPRPPTESEPGPRAGARRADGAAGLLARRAARAGSPAAATTPVGAVPAPPDVGRLLGEGGPRERETGSGPPPRAETPQGAAGSAEHPSTHLGRVADAVARLERRASQACGAEAPRGAAGTPVPGGERLGAGSGPDTPPGGRPAAGLAPATDPEAARESLGGLRGLLRRVAPSEAEAAIPAPRSTPPREAVPDLLAERMEDALLADRLAAVLRREAMCQGIDLERGG